jgi:L-lactate dehydrogenase complex protein LldG
MTAREDILQKIRSALEVPATDTSASYSRVTRSYRRLGSLDTPARVDLLIDRLVDYDSEVLQVQGVAELPGAIATALTNASVDRAVVSPAFPKAWLPTTFPFIEDHALSIQEIEAMPAVVTTCEAAVASTGTILLVHGEHQARRALTLLPNHHICLIRRDQVFELLPEALAAIAPDATKPITTISGPSATSDIEMTRIRGVHGPHYLTAILYG